MTNTRKHATISIDQLLAEMDEAGVQRDRMSNADLEMIFKICNAKDHIIWISDHSKLQPIFLNKAGVKFYGYPEDLLQNNGVELFTNISHPDHLSGLHKFIAFFRESPTEVFRMTHYVRDRTGKYKWIFTEERALNFDLQGNARHIISVIYNIEKYLDRDHQKYKSREFRRERVKYRTLTRREREVLDLVAAELTSQEIADKLNIEASTVDTHRKNLLRKLNIKSSLGMVKYSLRYSTGGLFA